MLGYEMQHLSGSTKPWPVTGPRASNCPRQARISAPSSPGPLVLSDALIRPAFDRIRT